MRAIDISVDVTEAVGTGEALACAATVFISENMGERVPVIVGFPGGGYNRRYFDLHIDGHAGYSQAEFHTAHGTAFIAIDHLGVGDSDTPTRSLDFAAVARANQAAAAELLRRLRTGDLAADVAPSTPSTTVAIGQSFGGFLLTIGQANTPMFDGVGFLGWSGVATAAPWPPDVDLMKMLSLEAGNGVDHPMRGAFHLPDVPDDIVIADMTKLAGTVGSAASWSTANVPGGPAVADDRNPLAPGVVADDAARIDVAVFIGCGAVDVVTDPRNEAHAYTTSPHITIAVLADMAHMHNFATSRTRLWEHLASWHAGIAPAG